MTVTGWAYYQFTHADGGCVVGWFEDWWTPQRKLDWPQHQPAGLAMFPLGYDNGEPPAWQQGVCARYATRDDQV
jgi:hypothetical protein